MKMLKCAGVCCLLDVSSLQLVMCCVLCTWLCSQSIVSAKCTNTQIRGRTKSLVTRRSRARVRLLARSQLAAPRPSQKPEASPSRKPQAAQARAKSSSELRVVRPSPMAINWHNPTTARAVATIHRPDISTRSLSSQKAPVHSPRGTLEVIKMTAH